MSGMSSKREHGHSGLDALTKRFQRRFDIVIGTGGKAERLLSGTFDDPETGGKITVNLVRGGHEHEGSHEVNVVMGDSTMEQASVLPDQKRTVGYLIGFMEQLGKSEDAVWEWVSTAVNVGGYEEWVDSLSMQDRHNRLFEQGGRVGEEDPAVAKALEMGEWRDTNLGTESAEIVKELVETVDRNGRKCYETAQKAINVAWEYDDRVKYCEGYCLPRAGVRATRHAWVEIDGSVCELTWPWHAPVDDNAVYYGTKIPRDVLKERMAKEDRNYDPMILDNEEWADYLEKLGDVLG